MSNQEWIDRPRAIREGEELDLARLEEYLKEQLGAWEGPLVLEQFPSGHSNLTYLLRAGEQQWVLRRPPAGAKKIKRGHDMGREYRILTHLRKVYPKVPQTLLMCEDEAILGAPFYLMERVQGVILRHRPPKGMELTPENMRALSTSLVDHLVELHAVDVEAAGLGELGRPEGYIQRQVTGWTERYKKAQTDEIADMERLATWLADNIPPQGEPTLIHNDYKYDNLVLDPDDLTQVRAVLDWEMATVGEPLSDLGTTLGYWMTADDPDEWKLLPFGMSTLPGNLNRREIIERYAEKSGRDISHMLFYYVNALFKIAVVLQQIYYRYKQGFTKDERFANFILGIHLLAMVAAKAIDLDRIEPLND